MESRLREGDILILLLGLLGIRGPGVSCKHIETIQFFDILKLSLKKNPEYRDTSGSAVLWLCNNQRAFLVKSILTTNNILTVTHCHRTCTCRS